MHVAETQRKISHNEAHKAVRKARKNKYKSILDRFLKSPRWRKLQTDVGWDEDICARYDAIAVEDHSYIATQAERSRNDTSWKLVPNTSGKNGPMDQRYDYQEAERTNQRL